CEIVRPGKTAMGASGSSGIEDAGGPHPNKRGAKWPSARGHPRIALQRPGCEEATTPADSCERYRPNHRRLGPTESRSSPYRLRRAAQLELVGTELSRRSKKRNSRREAASTAPRTLCSHRNTDRRPWASFRSSDGHNAGKSERIEAVVRP